MNTSKEGIKEWLSRYPERDRLWLATKCEVEKRTVDNWLSSPQSIPAKALRIIEALMRADQEKDSATRPTMQNLVLQVEPEEFNDWNLAALSKHKVVTEYCLDAIRAAFAADQSLSLPKNGTEG